MGDFDDSEFGLGDRPERGGSADERSEAVWRDICDELADHLATGEERGVVTGLSPREAAERARARFGDPRGIALKLYWMAMKDRLSAYRVVTGASVLVAVAAVSAAVAVIASGGGGAAVQYDSWGRIDVEIEGAPDGLEVDLRGPVFGGETKRLSVPTVNGVATFEGVHIGDYGINIRYDIDRGFGALEYFNSVRLLVTGDEVVRTKLPKVEQFVPLEVEVLWPDDLQDRELAVWIRSAGPVGLTEQYPRWSLIADPRILVCGKDHMFFDGMTERVQVHGGQSPFAQSRNQVFLDLSETSPGWSDSISVAPFWSLAGKSSFSLSVLVSNESPDDQFYRIGRVYPAAGSEDPDWADESDDRVVLPSDYTTDPALIGGDGTISWTFDFTEQHWAPLVEQVRSGLAELESAE